MIGGFYDFPFFLSFSRVTELLFGERCRWSLKFILFSCVYTYLAFVTEIVEVRFEKILTEAYLTLLFFEMGLFGI